MKQIQKDILNSIINCVCNKDLIETICNHNNITIGMFYMLFPNGINSILSFFFKEVDLNMIAILSNDFYNLPIHMQVSLLLKQRFIYMYDHQIIAKKILTMQKNKIYMMNHIAKTSDYIWINVKHTSHSIDYYTRRIKLGYIYMKCLVLFKSNKSLHNIEQYIDSQITKYKKRDNII